nr:GDSL-type esterase/lipase family protein [Armatimonas sp.]
MDVLLVGDSITQQWGSPLDKGILDAAWKKHFGGHKTLNIGIGGDKGIQPRLIVVMIGNNNMFFTAETGIEAAAKGVTACVENVRAKVPQGRSDCCQDPARPRARQ